MVRHSAIGVLVSIGILAKIGIFWPKPRLLEYKRGYANRAEIDRFGQKWKYGPKYAKFNFQADGHLIFGLWCPTNEYFAKNWSILYNRGLPGISALPERRENSKYVM